MSAINWNEIIKSMDTRRDIAIPGNREETLHFSVEQIIKIANESIADHDYFSIALSGGSTPKAIFQALADPKNRDRIDWTKVKLYWSDERAVPHSNPESNFKMAMDAGFSSLPIPESQIFRMEAEKDVEHHAHHYESLIKSNIPDGKFDFVMLGMGEDGHTASLFPHTHGLHSDGKWVVGNFIPEKDVWRMTLTYECINRARNIVIYVLGTSKAPMVKQVFTGNYDPDQYPIQKVGTPESKALWVLDIDASKMIT